MMSAASFYTDTRDDGLGGFLLKDGDWTIPGFRFQLPA
jgi:hypothetical protein